MSYHIQADLALPKIKASSIEQAYEIFTKHAAPKIMYPAQNLLDHMMLRENNAGSGIGDGVAIPHMKLPSIRKRFVGIMSVENGLDFNAVDEQDVDLICVLLSPESDGPLHLRGLSRISRLLKSHELCQKLRDCNDEDAMKNLILNPEGWLLAA